MASDLYALLGVPPNASEDEIKRAYRALARQLHPDANPNDPAAEARFKEVTAAYETLRDPERRRRYDTFGDDGRGATSGAGAAGPFGFGDLFDAFFSSGFGGGSQSGAHRAPDVEAQLDLDLGEAAFGTTRLLEITLPTACERCEGAGCEPGTFPTRCETCGGSGEVRQVRRSILGQLVTAGPCPSCDGSGQMIPSPCRDCRGDGRVRSDRRLDVEVPAGIDEGQRLRLAGRGAAAPRGGASGDLYVTVRVRPHPTLERHGIDLLQRRGIGMTQAALGTTIDIDTLEGSEELVVPGGTQPGEILTLRGRGVPVLQGRGRGDLHVLIEVEVPRRLSDAEADLVRQLADHRGEAVAEPGKPGLFSRLRASR